MESIVDAVVFSPILFELEIVPPFVTLGDIKFKRKKNQHAKISYTKQTRITKMYARS
jgi:hypothetical protein